MPAPRVHLVSCRVLPEPDPDEPLLLAALAKRGVDAAVVAWDDPSVSKRSRAARDARDADLCVIRSAWNYYHDRDAFLAWVDRVARATRVCNPPRVVEWNTDKSYLRELGDAGIRVAPTVFVGRGETTSLRTVMDARGWDEVVVKPVVSAASFATLSARRDDDASVAAAESHLANHLRVRAMMVQRFVASVASYGEHGVVWIDGAFTHAVRKSPRFAGQEEHVSGALPIADDERRLAERALQHVGVGDLLYARIDVARDDDGAPLVMELELVEPSLFLREHDPACARFADAIARVASR